MTMVERICSYEGCGKPRRHKLYCDGHYAQLRRGGQLRPLRPVAPKSESVDRVCPCGKQFRAHASAIARGYGKYCSITCRGRFSDRSRERSSGWKGDAVGYAALHTWVRREKGEPQRCESCGATEGRIEWANRSHEYRRDPTDWIALCKPCHCEYDFQTCRRGHARTPENTWIDKQGYPHCRPCRNERLRLQRRGRRGEWDAQKRQRQTPLRKRFRASRGA